MLGSFDYMYKDDLHFLIESTTSSMYDWYAKSYEQEINTTQTTPSPIVGAFESSTSNSIENMRNADDAFKKHFVESSTSN